MPSFIGNLWQVILLGNTLIGWLVDWLVSWLVGWLIA